MSKTTENNVVTVLTNFTKFLEEMTPDERETYVEEIDDMLDCIASNDGFGTEGQLDPRGDQRG